MNKILSVFITLCLLFLVMTAVTAQDQKAAPSGEKSEVIVFAAASMTESMSKIAEMYKKIAPDITIIYNFDSSGTLKTQIEEGADCDIFISAGQKQMDQLDIKADPKINTDKLDFILEESRFNLVNNTVVLIVPEGSKAEITSFDDVMTDKVKLVALGNSDVPVGQYSEEIFSTLGIWDKLKSSGKISYATNVKEVLSQVEAAAVDCGVVYSTDAATAKGISVVAIAPEKSHKEIVYPAAILKTSKNQEAAKAFLNYLKSSDAASVFEEIGFSIPKK